MAEPQVAPTLQSFQPRSGSKRLRKANVGPITTKGLRLQDGIQVTVAPIPPESPKMKALLELLFPSDGGVAGA
jgi:hypothetical protein